MGLQKCELIPVLEPTVSRESAFAIRLANALNSEIISADSRQVVYRKMIIGTEKDLDNYIIEGKFIPCHLIDVEKYNVFRFQHDFHKVFTKIKKKGVTNSM